ncbi:hypothetical protein KGO95_01645 [Patescibacteria group bacterium]|nr:hypothetical protein [Patescibacteria group bacterium]
MTDFDLKEKFKTLRREGAALPKTFCDLGVAFWLLNPDEAKHEPEYLSERYLHTKSISKKALAAYAEKRLKEYKLEALFRDVELPLIPILAEMELRGIAVDRKALQALDAELGKKITALAKDIYRTAGGPFNINSPKQLGQILFEKLAISGEGVKKTKGGAVSTNIDTLMTIKERHPIVKYILEYRELFKLQSTYVKPLQELADTNGRVHTTYLQTGTSTGRLSSQNPNLQNIPTGGEWANRVRSVFVPEKGYAFVSFDYSQIELRVLASLCGDPQMIKAFTEGADIHRLTAANVFNVPIANVTPEMRRLAKTLNFGVVYGMGAQAFAKTSGLSFTEAKKFIDEYFHDFAQVKTWQEEIKAFARTHGYVVNRNGRRRLLLHATSMFRGEAAEAERAAINMPVQGLAADIVKIAMVNVAAEIRRRKWDDAVRMLLTIHDELLFEVRKDILKEAIGVIQPIMERAYTLEVPLTVNVKTGTTWGDLA